MIDVAARGAIHDLEARLRPYLARRLRQPSDVDDAFVLLRVQRGAAALRDDDRFGSWVYRIARNVVVDHVRVGARAKELAESTFADASEDDDATERELASYVVSFVAMLPSPYREALTLTELEGLTQREAAEMLGVSLSGMKSRVQRGRERLRAALEACCDIATGVHGRVIDYERRSDGRSPEGCCGARAGCGSESPQP